ncbi:MAG: hypothetical protein NVS2B4_04940 [Ramlibacter sp.]
MDARLRKSIWAVVAMVALAVAPLARAAGPVHYSVNATVAPGVNIGVSNGQRPVYQSQPVYVQSTPVVVAPRPVYVQPGPVYVQPPAYVLGSPAQGPSGDDENDDDEEDD